MRQNSARYFCNKECEYYPCHPVGKKRSLTACSAIARSMRLEINAAAISGILKRESRTVRDVWFRMAGAVMSM